MNTYYAFPASRGLQIATERDILNHIRSGDIAVYIKTGSIKAMKIPFGYYLYRCDKDGIAHQVAVPK